MKRYCFNYMFFVVLIWSCQSAHNSNRSNAEELKNTQDDTTANYMINAELVGWDSTVNLALKSTFSYKELELLSKEGGGALTVFCYLDSNGKASAVFINYCQTSPVLRKKYSLLLKNFTKYLCFYLDNYHVEQTRKGTLYYTSFDLVNMKLFSVDEIGTVDGRKKKLFNDYIDSLRKRD